MFIKFDITGKGYTELAKAMDGFLGLHFTEAEENGEEVYKGGSITIHKDGRVTLPKINFAEVIVHELVTTVFVYGIHFEMVCFKEQS